MKSEAINHIMELVTLYNRKMHNYGKSTRHYGTDHFLRIDQIHLINEIGQNPSCNLRNLADRVGSSVPALSQQVDRLKKMGLVEKHRSHSNLREIEITLTEDGKKAFDYHKQLDENYFCIAAESLNKYSECQLEVIQDFMHNLLNNDLSF